MPQNLLYYKTVNVFLYYWCYMRCKLESIVFFLICLTANKKAYEVGKH